MLSLTLIHEALWAQREEELDLQTFIESLFNDPQGLLNYEDLYERLLLLYENPINLNSASTEELQSLFMLSPKQIIALQNYITQEGKLLTSFELQYIEGFDLSTINKLLPFIIINPLDVERDDRPFLKRILTERNNYLLFRYERTLESKRGYSAVDDETSPAYAGNPDKLYLRYRVAKTGDFSLGFTTEKDPGEQIIWNKETQRFGTDFWSGHFMKENQGKWRKAIIGDYQLQLGQGLLFGSGLNTGKGSETINGLQKAHLGLRPYTSVVEGGFLRGIATTYKLNKPISITSFFSRLGQDATIREGEDEGFESYFSSLQTAGLHRTANEISKKNLVTETVYGINLDYKPDDFKRIGVIVTANHFSIPLLRSDQPYNQFEFSGKQNQNLSLYGNINWRQFNFFGEGAISKNGGKGLIAGLSTSLSDRIDFSMILRNYQRNFHSFRAAAFSEGSRSINEKGIYWGLKYLLNNKFYLSAYYDSFSFPWLRFRVDAPSSGNDYMVRLNYSPKRDINTYLQYRKRNKEENFSTTDSNQNIVAMSHKNQWLLNIEFKNGPLSFKSRVQYSNFRIENEFTNGMAFMQDAVFKADAFTLSGRMAIFDTEGSQNRQYAYERDVLYAFSIPGYSGRGIRNYLLLHYKVSRQIDVWTRVARTTFYDRNEIGTGLETIDGNKRTDIKFQIRYKIR